MMVKVGQIWKYKGSYTFVYVCELRKIYDDMVVYVPANNYNTVYYESEDRLSNFLSDFKLFFDPETHTEPGRTYHKDGHFSSPSFVRNLYTKTIGKEKQDLTKKWSVEKQDTLDITNLNWFVDATGEQDDN